MSTDDVIHRFRLRVFALAKELGNVRAACRQMGTIHPRTTGGRETSRPGVLRPFGPGLDGLSRIRVGKDRHGSVRAISSGGSAAGELRARSDGRTLALEVEAPARDVADLATGSAAEFGGAYLTTRLGRLTRLKEEFRFLQALRTAGDDEEQAVAGSQGTDATSTAIAKIALRVFQLSGMMPTYAVVHPAVLLREITECANTGTGFGGFLHGPPGVVDVPMRAWGMRRVVTKAAADTVCSQGVANVFTRDASVESSPEYSTFFGAGLTAVRASLRSALAFERPSGVGVLALAGSSDFS